MPVKPASFSALTVRNTCSMQGLKQHIRVVRSFCNQQKVNEILEHGGKTREMNTHAKRSWHVRQHPMVLEDREKLKVCASFSGRMKKKGNLGTRVRFVNYGKTILDDISMLDSYNVIHAVSCEFFSVKIKKRLMPFLEEKEIVLLCFSKSRLMEFVRP